MSTKRQKLLPSCLFFLLCSSSYHAHVLGCMLAWWRISPHLSDVEHLDSIRFLPRTCAYTHTHTHTHTHTCPNKRRGKQQDLPAASRQPWSCSLSIIHSYTSLEGIVSFLLLLFLFLQVLPCSVLFCSLVFFCSITRVLPLIFSCFILLVYVLLPFRLSCLVLSHWFGFYSRFTLSPPLLVLPIFRLALK